MLTAMAVAIFFSCSVALAAQISGNAGNNRITGTNNSDEIYGLNGDDEMFAYRGADRIYGGQGDDEANGGPGSDEIYGGSGFDRLFGGDGRDYINSADRGRPDIVNCGGQDGASDTVVADPNDSINGCTATDTVDTD